MTILFSQFKHIQQVEKNGFKVKINCVKISVSYDPWPINSSESHYLHVIVKL